MKQKDSKIMVMICKISFIFILQTICIITNAQNRPSSFDGLCNSDGPRNLRVDGTLSVEFKRTNPNQFQIDYEVQKNKIKAHQIDKVLANYKKTAENNEIGYSILKGNNLLIKNSLMCFSKNVRIPILCEAADAALERVEELVKKTMDDETTRLLKTGLNKVLAEKGKVVYDQVVSIRDPSLFIETLNGHTQIMDKLYSSMDDVKSEDKDIVLASMIKASDKAIQNNFKQLNNSLALTESEAQTAYKNITSLGRAFYRFAKQNNESLKKMISLQQEAVGLSVANLQISQNIENKVSFLQNFTFSRMTPAEQIVALNSGIMDPLIPDEKKEILKAQLKAEIKRKEINNTIAGYLNGASEIVEIAEKLGLNPRLLSEFKSVVNIGNNAFAAFQAIQSGNILGAVNAVASLFGFGGRDIAAERHEEIMNALKGIYSEIGEIKIGINALLEGQKLILENQQKTYEALITINKKIDENQKELLQKLDRIDGHIIYNRALILEWVKKEYRNCFELIYQGTARSRDTVINTYLNKIPTLRKIERLCKGDWNQNKSIEGCFDLISRIEDDQGIFSQSLFDIRSSQTGPEQTENIDNYLNFMYTPLINELHSKNEIDGLTTTQRFTSLFTPQLNYKSLYSKLILLRTDNIDISSKFGSSFSRNFQNCLSFESVEKFTNYMLDIYIYRTIIDRQGKKPFSTDDLVNNMTETGYRDLQKVLNLIDYSIAQQNILSGDIILPILYFKMTKNDSVNSKKNIDFIRLLNTNPILSYNFLIWAFNEEIKEKSSFLAYSASFDSKDSAMLSMNFNHIWETKWSDSTTIQNVNGHTIRIPKGWSVKVGDKYYAMPSPKDLRDGNFIYNIEIQKLLALKQRVIEEIQTFEVYNHLNSEEKAALIFSGYNGLFRQN